MHVWFGACENRHKCVVICGCMCVYAGVCACIYVCVCMYICIYIYMSHLVYVELSNFVRERLCGCGCVGGLMDVGMRTNIM